jgi:membrane associated rhomboid family serine protease
LVPALNEPAQATVFRGPRALCREYSLVLESKAIEHNVVESEGEWLLVVPVSQLRLAYEEIGRYSMERDTRRPPQRYIEPFGGAAYGTIGYAVILLLVAYAAGLQLFHADWFAVGALDSSAAARHQWWRAATALTLHVDQQHLLSNLLFGVLGGMAAGRMVGPGIAWAGGIGAAILANWVEMGISPPTHRAIGASTAVFAILGLITGLAWAERVNLRERRWHRWAPAIAGVCLLALTGGGGGDPREAAAPEHVDVLGHLLGFLFGTAGGWFIARADLARDRSTFRQVSSGAATALLVGAAWLLALRHH